jgi:hypothetical protein
VIALELQRRLTTAASPLRSVPAHPGIATTTLAAHSCANRINRLQFLLNDPEHGALPTLYAATQDVPANAYVGKRGLDAEVASQIWETTAALTGVSAVPVAA